MLFLPRHTYAGKLNGNVEILANTCIRFYTVHVLNKATTQCACVSEHDEEQ